MAIVGGGPAGCAVALSLRDYAPSLSIALIEASTYTEPRLGETLPPIGRGLLEHLGVWEAFRAQGHQPLYGTAAAWGAPIAREHPFIYTAHGNGWHLDRGRFDAGLASAAEARGVMLLRGTRVRDVARYADGSGWRLRLDTSELRELRARFLVDATGRAASIARRVGARGVCHDRLIALTQLFEQRDPTDPRTLVEAFRDGWCYTARLPADQRIACCLTDTDIARGLRLHEPRCWSSLLSSMGHVALALRDAEPRGPLIARAVGSRRLDPVAGEGWLAVGDAAATFDPLSSTGIVKALRSGIFASYAIADLLTSRNPSGVKRYAAFIRAEFDAYTRTHAAYYRAEQRWPESLFWRRRAAA